MHRSVLELRPDPRVGADPNRLRLVRVRKDGVTWISEALTREEWARVGAMAAPAPTAPAQPSVSDRLAAMATDEWISANIGDDDTVGAPTLASLQVSKDPAMDIDAYAMDTARRALLAASWEFTAVPTPPTPTGGAQPEADEVEALARALYEVGFAYSASVTGSRALLPSFEFHEPCVQDEYRAMARAALALAARRYGGEVAALRGTLENAQRQIAYTFSEHPRWRGDLTGSYLVPVEEILNAALALTPSAAAEAVQKMADAMQALLLAIKEDTGSTESMHRLAFAVDDAYDALSPFLPARGGEGR